MTTISAADRFADTLSRRMLVLDGAMGTMVQRLDLPETDFRWAPDASLFFRRCPDVLVLTRPECVLDIHRRYLEAGADIIRTNSFNAADLALCGDGAREQAGRISRESARLARRAADGFRGLRGREMEDGPFVAGCIGPTHIALSREMRSGSPSCTPARMAEAFRMQALSLMEGGVDLLLVETVFDLLNGLAAVDGVRTAFADAGREIPLMVSATLTAGGRLLSGETPEEFAAAFAGTGAICLGLNCGCGVEEMLPMARRLADAAPGFVSLHPGAGLPDASGRYRWTPQRMADALGSLAKEGIVDIIGGCCGTTPDHIACLRTMVDSCSAALRN